MNEGTAVGGFLSGEGAADEPVMHSSRQRVPDGLTDGGGSQHTPDNGAVGRGSTLDGSENLEFLELEACALGINRMDRLSIKFTGRLMSFASPYLKRHDDDDGSFLSLVGC